MGANDLKKVSEFTLFYVLISLNIVGAYSIILISSF
jgi:hypothetical protein